MFAIDLIFFAVIVSFSFALFGQTDGMKADQFRARARYRAYKK